MRWSADKLMVLFKDVVICLYMLLPVAWFFIKVVTSLYAAPARFNIIKDFHRPSVFWDSEH